MQSNERSTKINDEPVPTFYDDSNTDHEAHSVISTCQNEPSNVQKNFDPDAAKCPSSHASQCCQPKNLNTQAIFLDMIEKSNVTIEHMKRELLEVRAAIREYDEDAATTKTELAAVKKVLIGSKEKRFERVKR